MKKGIIFSLPLLMTILVLSGCTKNNDIKIPEPQTNNIPVNQTDSNLKPCAQSVLGLQFSYPKTWGDCNVSDQKLSFRTDFKEHKVDLIADIREINKVSADKEFVGPNIIKKEKIANIDNSTIYNLTCGGGIACTGLNINDKHFYEINWSVVSDQPVPKNLDGIWVPDYSFTPDDIWNILKSVKK